jgi:Na+-translocating ferredoxin:NAD+ oxidoreductase subunit B
VSLVDRILEVLPQTQCTRCGFPDCAAYADAIASGEAAINQCPPGGDEGIHRLSAVTGQAFVPLNPDNGVQSPRSVVWIDENWCIGCTLCIEACPVDAIIGTHKRMHTVIESECTGCELCLPVCPVDCMLLKNVSGEASGWDAWSASAAEQARQRYAARQARLSAPVVVAPSLPEMHKQSRVQAALARAKVHISASED